MHLSLGVLTGHASLSLSASPVLCVRVPCLCALGVEYVGRENTQNGVRLLLKQVLRLIGKADKATLHIEGRSPQSCTPHSPQQPAS